MDSTDVVVWTVVYGMLAFMLLCGAVICASKEGNELTGETEPLTTREWIGVAVGFATSGFFVAQVFRVLAGGLCG